MPDTVHAGVPPVLLRLDTPAQGFREWTRPAVAARPRLPSRFATTLLTVTQRKPRTGARSCAICHKPLGKRPTDKAKSGKTCHASCLKQAKSAGTGQPPAPRQWNTAAAEREFARNKEAVESGRTFRGHQSSGWRLGGSPSSSGESSR